MSSAIRREKTAPPAASCWPAGSRRARPCRRPRRRRTDRGSRSAAQVGAHPAGGVVRGRRHRDQVGSRVDPDGQARRDDCGEPAGQELTAEVTGVEVDVVGTGGQQHPVDPLGDHVPGGQLGQFVLAEHEAFAVGVHQVRALAPQRLGDQRLLGAGAGHPGVLRHDQRGRVELHELHVGDRRTGPHGQGDPVAGGDPRVRGGREDLPHAAGGQHHRAGQQRADTVLTALAEHVQGDPARRTEPTRTVAGGPEQIQHQRVLDEPDPRVAAYRRV